MNELKGKLYKVALLLLLCLPMLQAVGQSRFLDSLKKVLHTLPNDTGKVKGYMAVSNRILTLNAQESKNYADSALALSKALAFKDGEGNSYVRLGLACHALGKYESALENFNEGLKVFISLKDVKKQGKVYNNLGYTHMAMANYKIAIEHYFKAIEISKEKSDQSGLASAYTNVAIVFALKGDYDLAEQYFQSAIVIFRELKNDDMVYKNLLNISGINKDKGLYQKSIEQLVVVQAYYEKKGVKSEIARCMYILGANYKELKDYKAAREQFTKALKIYAELNNQQQIAGCKLRLSELSNINSDFDVALKGTEEALSIAIDMKARSTVINSYKQLAEIHNNMKQFEKAYKFRLKYEELKDSVYNEESNNKINELEARYQNKVRKNEIKELQAINTINELNLRKQKNLKYFLAGITVFVVSICLMIFNQYRIKRKNIADLEGKNRIIEVALQEKEVLLQEIHHRVKNNLQFVWSLLNLHTRYVKDKQTLATLVEAKNRIKTMALIHQKLYQTNNLKGIDMNQFIPNLTESLFDTYKTESGKIELVTDVDSMVLDVDTALPIALIMNELITNALKYAFEGREKARLNIQLKKREGSLLLTVKDNGKGFETGEDDGTNQTFGLKLVHSLAKQLKADVVINSENGVNVEVKIMKYQFA